jgi:hypothetical protein
MTTIRWYHTWWTHLPALALGMIGAGLFASVASVPGPVPVHFGLHGPDRYGAPWEVPLAFVLAAFTILTISGAIDAMWAQYEGGQKRFNFLCLIDELTMTLLLGAAAGYVEWLRHPNGPRVSWHPLVWIAGVAAVVAAIVLERLRPTGPRGGRHPVDTAALVRDLSVRQAAGQRWVYWSDQAPLYVRLMALLPIGLVILMIVDPRPRLMWLALAVAMVGALLVSGGFRTQVTPAGLVLRAGAWGPRFVRVAAADIAEAAACEFNPLRQFGGWGIRRGSLEGWGGVWGYFLEGNTGVVIRTRKGKCYLIGAGDPESLLAVVNVARGAVHG